MTATAVEFAPSAVTTCELRVQARNRFAEEFLLLRAVERPSLLEAIAEAKEVDDLGRALAIIDYRLAAIQDFLRTGHDPHPDGAVCPDCCVFLDQGEGPQWFLLAALPEEKLPIIASDSALGRALIGARPGEVVEYPTLFGLQTARVLALEPSPQD